MMKFMFFCVVTFIVAGYFSSFSECSTTSEPEMVKMEKTLRTKMENSYDKEVRPNRTVMVDVIFHLMAINEVNTKDETLSSTGYFILDWYDSRLAWEATQNGNIGELFYDELTIWRPSIVISNEVKKINVISNEKVPMRVSFTGLVEWAPPLLMTTSCDMVITYYPFDRQTCSITIRSWSYYMNEISLLADHIDMSDYSENGEWIIENQRINRKEEKKHGHAYSTLSFDFYLQRRPGFYVLNSVVPTILMSFLCPVVFILPADAGEKVSYSITVFLAYAVLLSMITDTLPTSSKSTSCLSVFLTMITVFGALAVLVTVKILEIYHRDESKEIPALTRKFTFFLEKLLCRKRHTPHSNVIKPAPVGSDLPKKKPLSDDNADDLTWKDIAVIWDKFLFRATLLLSIIMAVIFMLMLFIPYYTTDNTQVENKPQTV